MKIMIVHWISTQTLRILHALSTTVFNAILTGKAYLVFM